MILNVTIAQKTDTATTVTFSASLMVEDEDDARSQGREFSRLLAKVSEGFGEAS